MLIHKWRDSDINQMPEVGQLGKYSIPLGYVNATQMCHANNPLLRNRNVSLHPLGM
jgi:hypothetical protein